MLKVLIILKCAKFEQNVNLLKICVIKYLDLGFDIDDSEYLAAEYERQAKERYAQGQYVLHKKQTEKSKAFGQTINIMIELTGNGKTRRMLSGWMVHPLGLITSATPFSGYVR